VVEIQEIKGQLLNVYNSMNFLKKIGVPVDSFNKNIKNTMQLLKEGNLTEAKKEVLFIRKETGGILTRMDNIHNGLLQIEKEIAKMVKKGMNAMALRRLYSQCRLALKDKDYDQVQLFIIKMDKIIEMYNFLAGPALLVDVDEGEMIEEIITRMEVEVARGRKEVSEKVSLSNQGRYGETDEDLPILVPLYDEDDDEDDEGDNEEDDEEDDEGEEDGILDNKLAAESRLVNDIPEESGVNEKIISEYPVTDALNKFEKDEKEGESVVRENTVGEGVKKEGKDEMRSRLDRINTTIRDNDIVDDDLIKGTVVLEKLVSNEDRIGANELAEELERLLNEYIERRDMEKVTSMYKEARSSLLALSEMKIDTKNIRILYDRAVKLRDRGELDIAARLFREVIGMCRDRELSSIREKELRRIKELKEKIGRIPSQLLDGASIEDELDCVINKLNEGKDTDEMMEELEKKIGNAYNVYMKENLEALENLFSEKLENVKEKKIPVNSLYIIREKARASLVKENWNEAGEQLKRGLDEIELTIKIVDHEMELDQFERDLDLLDSKGEKYIETKKYVSECRNMILRRDENNFCLLFKKAREISGNDIGRIKSHSYLSRLDNCIAELPSGEMKKSYTKRYLEAKSKSDEGRYVECLELTTSLINEITVRALENIR